MKVNLHWIAELSNFAAEKDEKFTRAKLKVFYKGETADHRLFSNEFSDKLRKTLPYTPVVGYYDAKKDDFVAHSTQQQIYGIVDPNSTFEYVKDDDGKD
jgi:muconolactone delta-isomerase